MRKKNKKRLKVVNLKVWNPFQKFHFNTKLNNEQSIDQFVKFQEKNELMKEKELLLEIFGKIDMESKKMKEEKVVR